MNNTTGGSKAALSKTRALHIPGAGLAFEAVNSAPSLRAKFHSTFPSSKSLKWKKIWF